MSLETAQNIVREGIIAAGAICRRLSWSHERITCLFPLAKTSVEALTNEDEERLDAYLHRFNALLSMIQDHLFKGIALLEQEDISNKSNRDKTNLMEKLGVIASGAGFSTMAELRNKLAHHYPNEAEKQAERLNAVYARASDLIDAFWRIVSYADAKTLVPDLERDFPEIAKMDPRLRGDDGESAG